MLMDAVTTLSTTQTYSRNVVIKVEQAAAISGASACIYRFDWPFTTAFIKLAPPWLRIEQPAEVLSCSMQQEQVPLDMSGSAF